MPEVASLWATIGARTQPLQKGLQDAKRQLTGFRGNVQAADKSMSRFTGGVQGATAALGLFAAAMSVRTLAGWAESAARADAVAEGFERRLESLGFTYEDMHRKLRRASQGMISDAKMIQGANRAMLLIGDKVAKDLPDLMRIATRAAREMGESQEFLWWSVTTGIGRATIRILDNLGFTKRADQIYEEWAQTIGTTADQLTTLEQKQALVNAVLDWGRQRFADLNQEMEGFDVAMAQFRANLENAKRDIGTLLIPSLDDIVKKISTVVEAFHNLGPEVQGAMITFARNILLGVAALKAFGATALVKVGVVIALFNLLAAGAYKAKRALGLALSERQLAWLEQFEREGFAGKFASDLQEIANALASRVAPAAEAVIPGVKELRDEIQKLEILKSIPKDVQNWGAEFEKLPQPIDKSTKSIGNWTKAWEFSQQRMKDWNKADYDDYIKRLRTSMLEQERQLALLPEGSMIYKQTADNLKALRRGLKAVSAEYELLGFAAKIAKVSTKGMADMQRLLIQHLVATHPAVIALTTSIASLEAQQRAAQAAQQGLSIAMHNAQRSMGRLQEQVSGLNRELSDARRRLDDLTRVKLPGQTDLEKQIQAVEDYLNAVRLARLTGQKMPESPMAGLIPDEDAIRKVLEILRLRLAVEYEPLLRKLREAAEDTQEEMTFEDALQGIMDTKDRISELELAVSAAESAVKRQQKSLAGLSDASFWLSIHTAQLNEKLAIEKERLDTTKKALTEQAERLILNRKEMVKLGIITEEQSRIIDAALRSLHEMFLIDTGTKQGKTLSYIDEITRRARTMVDLVKRMLQDTGGWGGAPPSYQHGGTVAQTGLALVHKGERVLPAGRSRAALPAGATIHVHVGAFLGRPEDARMFGDFLRRELGIT
jgi:hypothetical protein